MMTEFQDTRRVVGGGTTEYANLDFLKLVLAYLVVLRHCGQAFFPDFSVYRVVVTNSISPIAVPCFFVISGFLFFRKSTTLKSFYRQALRVVRLYAVWSLIYLPLRVFLAYKTRSLNWGFILSFIQDAVFNGTYYHLCYLPSLVIALGIVYVLRRAKKKGVVFGILTVLYSTALLTDTYIDLVPGLYRYYQLYQAIFVTSRNGLFVGTIFVYVGGWIADHEHALLTKPEKGYNNYFLICIVLQLVESYLIYRLTNKTVVNITAISVLMSPLLVICALKARVKENGKSAVFCRHMSTLIYCSHVYVIFAVQHFSVTNNYVSTMITIVIISLLGIGFAGLIQKKKFEYLV